MVFENRWNARLTMRTPTIIPVKIKTANKSVRHFLIVCSRDYGRRVEITICLCSVYSHLHDKYNAKLLFLQSGTAYFYVP